MKKILVVYAHPRHAVTRINSTLINNIKTVESVTISNLYDKYPAKDIDISEEQTLLLKNDLIILQFPFYWFNTTPLMKQWLDEVLARGFAYGHGGDKLTGKDFMVVLTIGGGIERYNNPGFTLPDLLKPFEYIALYCNMHYRLPFIVADDLLDDKMLHKYAIEYATLLKKYISVGSEAFNYGASRGFIDVSAKLGVDL